MLRLKPKNKSFALRKICNPLQISSIFRSIQKCELKNQKIQDQSIKELENKTYRSCMPNTKIWASNRRIVTTSHQYNPKIVPIWGDIPQVSVSHLVSIFLYGR